MDQMSLEQKLEVAKKPKRFAKILEWLRRYGPAEIIGIATAYCGFFLAQKFTDSPIIAAYAGSAGENVGYYGTMALREAIRDARTAKKEGRNYRLIGALKTAGKLFTEFGAAEVLDSLVVRPAAIGFGVELLGKETGVAVGAAAANISFYAPTIVSYEIRNKACNKTNQHV